MDDSGSWSETSSPDATLPSLGKKAKGKAPLPPGEARYGDGPPSCDSGDMDQKENLDRDIELNVVLPGDRITSTIVHGSKPMMDLLVFLCGQYHLNPSTYTIELLSADKSQLKFKPNTPIGMLEVERVVLKSKNLDERNKKPGPTMPEQTVRVVINYRRTQKTVMRVSPFVPLQELLPFICNKCDFEPQSTVLLQDYQSHKALDLSKSLNDLGLRELYAMDQSKATSPTEFRLPPLQESCQNVETKQHDDKGFFNFFRRSTKKKRDQISSAPATPVLSKPRPPNVVTANPVTKPYDSNTMPSNVPKKRRAPLPPMHPTHNNGSNISRGQFRSASCVVKSAHTEESEKAFSGFDRSRTGSFQHPGSSDFNSSLRRTKRKAPPPPSPPPNPGLATQMSSEDTAHVSAEINHVENHEDHLDVTPHSEVTHESEVRDIEEESSASVKIEDSTSSMEGTNGPNEETVSASSSGETCAESLDEIVTAEIQNSSMMENISKISDHEITTDGTSSLYSREEAANENTTLEYDKIGESENRTSTPTSELENREELQAKADVGEQASQTVPTEQYTETTKVLFPSSQHVTAPETRMPETLWDATAEKGKTQDSAVQTGHLESDWRVPAETSLSHSQEMNHVTTVNGTGDNRHILHSHTGLFNDQQVAVAGREQSKQELANVRETVCTQTSEESVADHSLNYQSKENTFYKQHSDPKLKSSNEITRDYLPKIGMTTYKIVPQRSFDAERYESPQDVENTEYRSVNEHVTNQVLADKSILSHVHPVSENREEYISVNEHVTSHVIADSNILSHVNTVSENRVYPEVKNGNHSLHGSGGYSFNTVSKTVSEPNARTYPAFSRSLSAAPIINTEKSMPPEVKPKPKPPSPVKGPSSFYLQMQRRASSMYVTSAIAKSKSSSNVLNTTPKVNDAPHITVHTLPSRITVENVPSTTKEKQPEDRPTLPERPQEVKNGGLGAIREVPLETEIPNSASHFSTKSAAYSMQSEVSSGGVSGHKKHVTFEEPKQNDVDTPLQVKSFEKPKQNDVEMPLQVKSYEEPKQNHVEAPLQVKSYESGNTILDGHSTVRQVIHEEDKTDVVSTTTFSQVARTSTSPTSAPLSLEKLRTFVTPRPFSSINPVPFSSTSTTALRRSQSFGSSVSPTKPPLHLDAPIGWSPVSSPVDSKKESLVFSSTSEEITKDQTLIPELKYRVHSPPPVPEKKIPVSFPSSDPEELRQNILSAIRSGEAAAGLKRITIRSNTISINGRSRIGHPTFSQSVPEE